MSDNFSIVEGCLFVVFFFFFLNRRGVAKDPVRALDISANSTSTTYTRTNIEKKITDQSLLFAKRTPEQRIEKQSSPRTQHQPETKAVVAGDEPLGAAASLRHLHQAGRNSSRSSASTDLPPIRRRRVGRKERSQQGSNRSPFDQKKQGVGRSRQAAKARHCFASSAPADEPREEDCNCSKPGSGSDSLSLPSSSTTAARKELRERNLHGQIWGSDGLIW